ncbi:hypothetical protein MKX57_09955 [Lysinibacillus sp. FSL M8-0216]|uniref:Uncharacterized protein n=1 Tax=Lysinibacillus fusiformis TaxID=28031 RepID=A0A1H9AA99_9BACI|nr:MULTISPECIES: hypothetical protein [Lysinibacillus]MCG7435952.1 hypothetical protein [Lysinibacillus fusiformis]MED4672411.1 hypothetical protein [Lysinibacillus fusiformis]NOG30505.1 hypothetical protein [Lysinibacillus fusiformis]QAS55602.1 hypothetical protein LSP_03965 [Lysinibacillus sphaericus]RDV30149.1 hypothetical protein C7B90_16070 [Lysinibacillus fusiformis]
MKYKIIPGLLLIILLSIIGALTIRDKLFATELEKGSYKVDSFESLPNKEITLLEAYDIGMDIAKEYDKNSELIFMNSVNDGKINGSDGKKGNWQGYITLPNKRLSIIFVIEKGKLKSYDVIDSDEQLPIKDEDIKVDSNEVVKKAISEFKLEPGNDNFLNGYHFRLIRDEKNVFLGVGGQKTGKRAEIYFNPKNGEYLGGIEKK